MVWLPFAVRVVISGVVSFLVLVSTFTVVIGFLVVFGDGGGAWVGIWKLGSLTRMKFLFLSTSLVLVSSLQS